MTVFAVAMAFLESAVVIYLRALYYPEGFAFPLAPIDSRIATTELVREFATLIMLLAPGALIIHRRLDRFAWFCYCFAVWDLFYYIFLKLLLGWPQNFFTWDILFLLPVPWVGPVLAPCLVSLGLLVLAVVLMRRRASDKAYRPRSWQWVLLVLSGGMILWTFVEEPCRHLLRNHIAAQGEEDVFAALAGYIPQRFQWLAFFLAYAMSIVAVTGICRERGGPGLVKTILKKSLAAPRDRDGYS
jgi:hypothetical protein